ncbi:uncharacterized protein LOC133854579 isoform X3 [Alnus glutinosa]|uniref:uncharacterized protein LOC133854579 isoform X3 n=1 Tax=Alnus glutinosa TaxID=3517 RepID=UPI002D7A3BD6|nr:uncharacterized protein LOC133854579 isoform X3 [Alnus glutinosa]
MGSCLRKSCAQAAVCNHLEVILRVVRTDGESLEYTRPMLVKDVLMSFSGYGIGLSERPLKHLPMNYELKVGHVYYLLPLSSTPAACPVDMDGRGTSYTKRMKVVITKKQLQELLSKKISPEEMLFGVQKGAWCGAVGSMSRWRPVLQTIHEGNNLDKQLRKCFNKTHLSK